MFKLIAGFGIFLFLMFPTIEKVYEAFVVGVGGSEASSSQSIFPKSEVPSKVNGVHWSKTFEGDNAEKMAGLK